MARVIGYTAVPVLMAPLLGPVVGGAILHYAAGWPWLFYINLPIGVLAVSSAIFVLPTDEAQGQNRPFDWFGWLLLSPAVAALLYGMDHASGREGREFILCGVILAGLFIWNAIRRDEEALIDLRLFRNRVFSIGATTQFLANGANYAGQMLVPLFLIAGCGISPAKAGWMLAPMGLGLLCINPLLAFLIERLGSRAVSVSGAIAAICGTLPFLWMTQNQISPIMVAACLFARGAGQGAVILPSISAAYLSVPTDQLPLAATASNIVQRFGGSIGSAVMAMVLFWSSASVPAGRQTPSCVL